MSTTYLEVVNNVLSEMNEVLLTSANFDNAVNIQRHTKNAINRAYFDMNNPEYKWPWLAVSNSQNEYYGNTYVETVAGTRWYLLNGSSTGINDDYSHADWEHFSLTEEGVAGKSAPYEIRNLQYSSLEEWRDRWAVYEERDKSDSATYGIPQRVLRNPDNRRFGLSPIPDGVYRIYFFAYTRPTKLTAHDDELVIPDQYVHVLESRALYYTWQRKEMFEQSQQANQDYRNELRHMRQQTIGASPDRLTDSRIRY